MNTMKPPLFTECSVCGREFGSKSIQIHEPQCLQKLRRTEIANQEEEETYTASTKNYKKSRRKKKSDQAMGFRASTSNAATTSSMEPSTTILHHHSAPSFVLMATSSNSTSRFTSKLNLPKIQTSSSSSARPSTAVLDKPRILNPEYSQYDMSLTRIDFTGQSTSAPPSTKAAAKMDENLNSRLHRQNTQVLDNSIRRHNFALPTVSDISQKPQKATKGSILDHSKLPTSGNMADTILGDPQKQARGDRSILEMANISGKRDDAQLVSCTAPTSPSCSSTTVFTSLWSKQQVYLMSTEPMLPPIATHPSNFVIPTSVLSKPDPFPDCDSSPQRDRSSPPVESIFAAPNFPFLSKLSHCDLEKPLRTCFHLDKIPRNAFELYQDNFVTSGASTEFPQLQQQQHKKSQDQHPAEDANLAERRELDSSEGLVGHTKPQEENLLATLHEEAGPGSFQQPLPGTHEMTSEEVVVLKSVIITTGNDTKSQNGLADLSTMEDIQPCVDTTTPNWIGKPFMQQHTYHTVPAPVKGRETDTDSEVYATPMAESHDEHDLDYTSTRESLLGVMQELRRILERRDSFQKELNSPCVSAKNQDIEHISNGGDAQSADELVAIKSNDIPEDNGEAITEVQIESPDISSQHSEGPSFSIRDDCISVTTTSKSSTRTVVSQSASRAHMRRKRSRDRYQNDPAASDADDESSSENSHGTRSLRRSLSNHRERRLNRRYSNFKQLRKSSTAKLLPLKSINLISFDSEVDLDQGRTASADEECSECVPEEDSNIINFQLNAQNDQDYPEKDEDFEALLTSKMFPKTEASESHFADSPLMDDGSIKDAERVESKCSSIESKIFTPALHKTHPEAIEVLRAEVSSRALRPLSTPELSGDEIATNEMKQVLFSDDEILNKFTSPIRSGKSDVEQGAFSEENPTSDRRRRSLQKRPTTSESTSLTDSVVVWEGSQIPEQPHESAGEQDIIDFFSQGTDISSRPPSRRQETENGRHQRAAINSKLQTLISNVNRVGQLHQERQNEVRRPRTVPANPHVALLCPPQTERPSTSLPQSKSSRKSISLPKRKKRANSKSAAPSTNMTKACSSNHHGHRPGTTTSIRIGLGHHRSLTVRTSMSEKVAIQDQLNQNVRRRPEDEPLELLFSFKKKAPKKRAQSPNSLITPVGRQTEKDKAELYKQIDRHRREALAEFHGSRRRILANHRIPTSGSPSLGSSGASTPRKRTSKDLPTRKVIQELRKQINFRTSPETPCKRIAKSTKSKWLTDSNGRRTPMPRSKRVTFSNLPYPPAARKHRKLKQTPSPKGSASNQVRLSFRSPTPDPKDRSKKSLKVSKGIKINHLAGGNDACKLPDRYNEPPPEQSDPKKEKKEVADKLDRLEAQRDKTRTKEFERRKRGKGGDGGKGGDNQRWSAASVLAPSRRSMQEDTTDDKIINVKVIVRRKNKDGTFPPIDEIVSQFSPKWNYLIIDEEPIAASSPSPYEVALENRAKAKTGNVIALKITTSDQSTVNSLSSEDAATRFLTCFVCGQSLNVKDYFTHEANCVKDIEEKNEFLAEEDKKELPPKPQGTITINHWNQFAHDAVKHKFITCPYCTMEFLPENQEDVELHNQICTNRPPPPPPPPRGIGLIEGCTIETALEVLGRVVPTRQELRRGTWNRGYERVEEYSRPASNRLKPYKRPKSERYSLESHYPSSNPM